MLNTRSNGDVLEKQKVKRGCASWSKKEKDLSRIAVKSTCPMKK
jgi:hypothetical protein